MRQLLFNELMKTLMQNKDTLKDINEDSAAKLGLILVEFV